MNLRNSVGARLTLSFAAVILAFGIGSLLSVNRLAAFHAGMASATGPLLRKIELANAWMLAISETNRRTRNMLILNDKAKIHDEMQAARDLMAKRGQIAEQLKSLVDTDEGKRQLQAALEIRQSMIPLEASFMEKVESGDLNAARDQMLNQVQPLQVSMFGLVQKLADYQSTRMHEQSTALEGAYRTGRDLSIWILVSTMMAGMALAFFLTRSIKRPLVHANEVLAEIGKGNYENKVVVTSEDEIGRTLKGLEAMQQSLKERTDREHAAASENARIRTALDRVSVAAMLADNDGKIVYVNDAAQALFRARAGDFRKALPQFDPERLLENSIDIFHLNPNQAKNSLAGLPATHQLDLKMGSAALRAVINSVHNDSGEHVGSIVQWIDRTQEVETELEVQSTVAKALEGDLTVRIAEEGKDGFFRVLSGGVNRLLSNMADVVRRLLHAAAQVKSGAHEISSGSLNLSQRTEEQASSLEETASSMEEMTSTVTNNAESASQANQLAAAAREHAERGGAVAGAAIAAMGGINASSKRIADIIGVIDEIAFQTNLLALNAAVEAARAGDQGRGFAVVATEVRSLASRSAEAAKEIKALIEDSVSKVTEGAKLVDQSGKALEEIVVRVKRVTDVIAEIASSSREQASGIEQVNKAIVMMDDVTQQNAALAEQASASAQTLTEQAASLTELIARYRVSDEDAAGEVMGRTAAPLAAQAVERRGADRPFTAVRRTQPVGLKRPRVAAASEAEEFREF